MSNEGRTGMPGDEPAIKVVDRRRFRPDGSEVVTDTAPQGAGYGDPPREDDRDVRLAQQASRIDELTRAYAALVEDQKAFRQRAERERARIIEAERAAVAQALLESADDLERTLSAALGAAGAGRAGGPALAGLVDGVRLSLAGLTKRIAGLGAERLRLTGQRFDPRVAEAVDAVTVADPAQDGVVVQEVRAGYIIGDRVLRPARVRVGRLARA
jgi:molecular chaperone GrpE